MGYSEIHCSICWVPFNICRIRTEDEPETAAWTYYDPKILTFVDNKDYEIQECRKTIGCKVLKTTRVQGRSRITAWSDDLPLPWQNDSNSSLKMDAASNADSEYAAANPNSVSSDEAEGPGRADFEYSSEGEARRSCDAESTTDASHDDGESLTDESERLYSEFVSSLGNEITTSSFATAKTSNLHPISAVPRYSERQDDLENLEFQEHIAGPACGHKGGYSGHRISVEEMRGCTTLQCLVRKPDGWHPEDDDEGFEREGRHFLSGLR